MTLDDTAQAPTRSTAGRPRLVLALLLTGQFMAMLDVAIVNVAAPTIRTDLDAGGSALQLVISGYTISYAVLLITGARLGERWGFDRVFQAGVAVFTLASLACGLAPDVNSLIAFRVLQGVGSALMVPQVMSMIQRGFTGPARLRALGGYTAVVATGMVAGQVLGGLLVTGSGWRPVFLLNVPVGVLLLVAGRGRLPSFAPVHRALDLAGLTALSAAVFLLVVPLVLGHEQGWPPLGFVMLAGSAVMLTGFVLIERRIAHPLIRGRVLRAPGLAAGALALFLVMAGVGGVMFTLALYLQGSLGQSPLRAGLTFAPMTLGFGLAGLLWRRLPVWAHPRLAFPALLLCAAGYALLGRDVSDGSPISAGLQLVMLLMGLLSGCAYGQVFAAALSRVAPEDAADASGVTVTLIQLGNVIGVAVFGTVYLGALPGRPDAGLALASGHAAELALLAVAASTAAAAVAALLRPRA